MDKSWLDIEDRGNIAYIRGVESFVEWAFAQNGVTTKIRCPCKKCMNVTFKLRSDVKIDLLSKGFWPSYKVWDLHGEITRFRSDCGTSSRVVENDTCEEKNLIRMVYDAYRIPPNFKSPKFQTVSTRNKENRGKQVTKHTCGSLSFVEVDYSAIKHTRKTVDGQLHGLDPAAEEAYIQMRDLRQEQGLQGHTRMTDDEILTSVLGQRSGYIRGKGYGAEPSRKRDRSQSSQTSLNHVRIQMQQYFDRKIQEEREKFEANLAAERAKMKEERAAERANLEEERAAKRAKIEEQAQFEQ